ncbi:hypothetical protein CRUP_012676 [Coryphaenoides rupestris]|nr:hypothetical protein CRUP_012676 [Coryphaenoides rupestris]
MAAGHNIEDATVNKIASGTTLVEVVRGVRHTVVDGHTAGGRMLVLKSPPPPLGLWNLVFLSSNLSLVFLMPFAYFFIESEGFAGSKKGVMARVYEAVVLLVLLVLLVVGMVWVASAMLHHHMARESLYDLWECYLPYFYSGISLFGVMLLLLCTPFGLSRMFSVTGAFLVKPRLLEDIEETLSCASLEEASLSRKLQRESLASPGRSSPRVSGDGTSCWVQLNMEAVKQEYRAVHAKRSVLEMRRKASPWQRNLGYPLVLCVLMVCFNVLQLLFDETAMPRGMEDPRLGKASFSMLGSLGATVQVVLILYPPLNRAVNVSRRPSGITRFDLLGDFGRYNWLGNFYVVFLYNMMFAGLTSASLIKTVTWAVQRELIRAFGLHRLPLTVSRSTIPIKLLLTTGFSKVQTFLMFRDTA